MDVARHSRMDPKGDGRGHRRGHRGKGPVEEGVRNGGRPIATAGSIRTAQPSPSTWWTFAENEASLALAKKMGFKEEGRTRDSVFFDNRYHDSMILGLLRGEYDASSKPSLSPRPKRSMRTKSS